MFCQQCGREIPEGSLFCSGCGARVTPEPQETAPTPTACPTCQAPLEPGQAFCSQCGTAIEQAAAAPPPADAEPVPAQAEMPAPTQPDPQQPDVAPAPVEPVPEPQAVMPPAVEPVAEPQAVAPPPPPAEPAPVPQAAYVPPQPAEPAPVPQAAYAPPPPPPAAPVYQQQPQQPVYAYQQPEAAPKAKSKTGLFVALAVGLVILLVVGLFVLPGTRHSMQRLVLGPKRAYLAAEARSMKGDAADLVSDLARIGNIKTNQKQGGLALELSASLPGLTYELDPSMVDALEDLSVGLTTYYDRNEKDPRSYTAIDLKTSGERVLTLEFFLEEDLMVVGLPDLLDAMIAVDGAGLADLMYFADLDEAEDLSPIDLASSLTTFDLGIREKKMVQSTAKVVDILLSHMDDVTYERNQKLKAGSVTGSYGVYTITMTQEDLKDTLWDVLEFIEGDPEFYGLFESLFEQATQGMMMDDLDSYFDLSAQDLWDDFFDEIFDELDWLIDEDDDSLLVQKVYVDAKGDIRGRELSVQDKRGRAQSTFLYAHPVDKKKEGLLLSFDDGYESYLFLAEYETEKDLKSGKASVRADGEELAQIRFKGLDAVVVDDQDFLIGDVEITVFDDYGTMDLPGPLIYNGAVNKGIFSGQLGIKNYALLNINYEKLDAKKAKIPAYDDSTFVWADDFEGLASLFTDDTLSDLMGILSRIGLDLDDLFY